MIRSARKDEIPAVGALVAHSFDELGANAYLVPDPAERERVMAEFFTLYTEHAFEYGRVDVVDAEDGGLAAAAVWFDRVNEMPEPPLYGERLAALAGVHLDRFNALDELFDAHHPHDEHWHLAFLAVHPSQQHRGLGGELMRRTHEELVANGVPAYLEATNENNVRLYKRHGYTPMTPFEIYLPDGTPFYRMWRAV